MRVWAKMGWVVRLAMAWLRVGGCGIRGNTSVGLVEQRTHPNSHPSLSKKTQNDKDTKTKQTKRPHHTRQNNMAAHCAVVGSNAAMLLATHCETFIHPTVMGFRLNLKSPDEMVSPAIGWGGVGVGMGVGVVCG